MMTPALKHKLLALGFYALVAVGLGLIGYWFAPPPTPFLPQAATSPGATLTAELVIELLPCVDLTQSICLRSTGFDMQGNLLVNLKVRRSPLPALRMRVSQEQFETWLTCQPVEFSPMTVYCLGLYPNQPAPTVLELYALEPERMLAAVTLPAGELVYIPVDTPTPTLTPSRTPESESTLSATPAADETLAGRSATPTANQTGSGTPGTPAASLTPTGTPSPSPTAP